MQLGIADLAALTGMMTAISGVLAVITKYYVKAEIRTQVDKLRLELKQERLNLLEQRAQATKLESN